MHDPGTYSLKSKKKQKQNKHPTKSLWGCLILDKLIFTVSLSWASDVVILPHNNFDMKISF